MPISLEVFPIGSNDVTNDIALGLKIPLEDSMTGVEILDGMGIWSREITPESSKEILDEYICEVKKVLDKHPESDRLLVRVSVGTPALKYKNDINMDLDYE